MAMTPYTATATSTGEGRGGRVSTSDGLLDVALAFPPELGGPGGATNPEQLFAAGWSSCFHSALKFTAAAQKLRLPDSTVTADVTITPADGGFGLSAELHVHLTGGISQADAEKLTAAAHEVCPYSVATRGNIPVTVTTTVN